MELKKTIAALVAQPEMHAKWLNTLSYMENCGARKISKCEHPTLTELEMLKHAAEEFRHAFYLKKMIGRVLPEACPNYEPRFMLGSYASRQYLQRIDIFASKYLKGQGFKGADLIHGAYLLVTYAIEVRADDLYPIYQKVLKANNSRVSVYNIIKEEEGHLEHIESSMSSFFAEPGIHAKAMVQFETDLFAEWVKAVEGELKNVAISEMV